MNSHRAILGLLMAGTLLLWACESPSVFTSLPPTPTPLKRTRIQESRPTITVKRDTLVEAIKVLGRVVAAQQAELFFTNNGRLRHVNVESGQRVQKDDLLLELETGDLGVRIARAQAAHDQQQLRLEAARAKLPTADTRIEAEAVRQAELALRQAELNLEQARIGPSESEIKSSEAAVIAAEAALQRARSDLLGKQADLAEKQADLELRLAGPPSLQVANARAGLESAKLRLAKLQQGPRQEDVRAAEISVDQAHTRLAQLRDAPRVQPEDIENARLNVEKAKISLEKAQIGQDQTSIRTAQISLEAAQNAYSKLQSAQPSPWDLRQAELVVAVAEARLAKLQTPDTHDVQQAELAVQQAQVQLGALLAQPAEETLAPLRHQIRSVELGIESAAAAIPSVEANLEAAKARLMALKEGPASFAIRQQEQRVELAQIALDQAKTRLAARQVSLAQSGEAAEYDLQSLEKVVEQARLDLAQLESQNIEAKIVAPFDGVVTRVSVQPGETVTAYVPIIFVANPEKLILSANIPEADTHKLAIGQRAELTMFDLFPNQTFEGAISRLPGRVVTRTGARVDRETKIDLTWPGPGVQLGMLARVTVVVQELKDVLIVPASAVRRVGKREFVEYMDEVDGRPLKRSRNVETGLSSAGVTEITSGLEEGQIVLAGP